MADYVPTTEEIREYVEVGGELRPWLPPTPDEDAKRAAAFDRWLTEHDRQIAEAAWNRLYSTAYDGMPFVDQTTLRDPNNPYRAASSVDPEPGTLGYAERRAEADGSLDADEDGYDGP